MLQEDSKSVTHRPLHLHEVKHLRRFSQKVLFARILFTAKLTPLLNMLTQRNDARNEKLTATLTKPFLFLTQITFFVGFQEVQQNQQRLVTFNSEAATLLLIYFAERFHLSLNIV